MMVASSRGIEQDLRAKTTGLNLVVAFKKNADYLKTA